MAIGSASRSVSKSSAVECTGKTTALAAAREAWEAAELPVRGCAVARKAAHKLRQTAGIDATSVTALLRRLRAFEPGTVPGHR
jgi:hypothetical protein